MKPSDRIRDALTAALFEEAPPYVFRKNAGLSPFAGRGYTVLEVLIRQGLWCAMRNKRFVNQPLLENLLARVGGKVALPLVRTSATEDDGLSEEKTVRHIRELLTGGPEK